jgi:hypothetical protein
MLLEVCTAAASDASSCESDLDIHPQWIKTWFVVGYVPPLEVCTAPNCSSLNAKYCEED